jgi:hypothetical protein
VPDFPYEGFYMPNQEVEKRDEWTVPEIRQIVPSSRTAGGPFAKNNQDDAFYKVS